MNFNIRIIFYINLFAILMAASCSVSRQSQTQGTQTSKLHGYGVKFDNMASSYSSPAMPPQKLGSYSLPSSFFLTASYFPPVGDQGQQGSCVAWSTTYYMKSYLDAMRNNLSPSTASNQYSPAWTYNQINDGADDGSYPSDAMNLIVYKGADTLSLQPYNQYDYTSQPTPSDYSFATNYTESGWQYLPLDINSIKAAMFSGKPVVIAIVVFSPDLDFLGSSNTYSLTGDVYCDTNSYHNTYVPGYGYMTSTNSGGHAICLVGYNDSKVYTNHLQVTNSGAFEFINQWGNTWDDTGYGWISYQFINNVIKEAVTFN